MRGLESSYSSTEQFVIHLDKVDHADFSIMISLDGKNFSEGISMAELRRNVLENMDIDCSKYSDSVVNDMFSKIVMNPVSMQRNGLQMGPFVCLEDITDNPQFNYQNVVESNRAKKSYFNFDLYLTFDYTGSNDQVSDEILNDSHSVLLSNANQLVVGPTKSVQLSKPYQFQDYFNQEEIRKTTVNVASASRVALTKYEVVERGHPEDATTVSDLVIYQGGTPTPTKSADVYSFGGIMDSKNNLAFTEYNNINVKKMSEATLNEFYQNRCNEKGVEDALAFSELEEGHWFIERKTVLIRRR